MMKTLAGLLVALAVLAMVPPAAHAQKRGRGNSTVNTPFGQFSTQDMQSAGGNPFAAEEIREQKMMMQYQQQMMKQQQLNMQQMAKQQKARQDYLKKNPDAARSEAASQKTARPKAKSATSAKAKAKATTAAVKSSKAAASTSSSKVPGAPE